MVDAITMSSEYLKCLGSMRTWPPAIHTKHFITEPNQQGWSTLKMEWKYHAIAAAFNFVGRHDSSLMCDTSPVPLSLLPSAITPLSLARNAPPLTRSRAQHTYHHFHPLLSMLYRRL